MFQAVAVSAVLSVSLARAADPEITADKNTVNPGILSFTVKCDDQKQSNELEVLLPDDYTDKKTYSVVYLLPVNTGTSGQWGSGIVEAKKANLQNEFEMIFVAPAYDTVPWFGDNPDNHTRQNPYITDVVLPFIESHFSAIKEAKGRFLVGFSKSGLGAWSLFLQHLDTFGQVAIFDSFDGPPNEEQWQTWGFVDTYGTRANYDKYNPWTLIDAKKDELKTEPRRITILGGGPGARVGVDRYHTILQDRGIPFVYIQGSYMAHTWFSGWLPLAVASLAHP